jgi:tetratricopeptide (TPR) repeat protein
MVFTKFQGPLPVCLCLAARAAFADSAAEIADLSARIDYGFYSEEPRVVEAASKALERLDERDPSVRYYRALGALRLAQLRLRDGRRIDELLDDCARQAAPVETQREAIAEGWILVAACASLSAQVEPMRALVHQRRRDQALERARQVDAANPRIALIEAWSSNARSLPDERAATEQAAQNFVSAVERFRSWTSRYDAPQWGEAEALAQLGEIRLRRGEAREARDLIERALLIAPDYRFALGLQDVLLGRRTLEAEVR